MKNAVLALGNFDGAHRGHRFVIDQALTEARKNDLPVHVLTFEPHPRSIFVPDNAPFRLTPFAVKERWLKSWGVDDVMALPFNLEFAKMSAIDFVSNILCKQLSASHIVAGHDFTFGHDRYGDMSKLRDWLLPHQVGLTEVLPVTDKNGALYSSTHIRDSIRRGDMKAATEMLGHDWLISGVVEKGAQRGRTVGVPTLNIGLGEYLRPRFGVYAVYANRVGSAQSYRGVANIGVRPTVDGRNENLEAHLFGFDQEVYGEEWEFGLTRFIRPEQKFESLEALKEQIMHDIAEARR